MRRARHLSTDDTCPVPRPSALRPGPQLHGLLLRLLHEPVHPRPARADDRPTSCTTGTAGVDRRRSRTAASSSSRRPTPRARPGARRQRLRAWQREAIGRYFETGPRDFLAVATPGAGKTTFALTIAAELLVAAGRRPDHRGRADRAPQDPVGRGRRAGRHPDRPGVLRRQGAHQQGLRRHRGHLRRGGGQPAGAPGPHRAVQDPGDPRRDPPRRRRAVLGRGRARGVRAGAATARADRHAVPLRREPDPVRHLRARTPTGCRVACADFTYGYGARAARPRRAAGAVLGVRRRPAVAHPRRRRGRRPGSASR